MIHPLSVSIKLPRPICPPIPPSAHPSFTHLSIHLSTMCPSPHPLSTYPSSTRPSIHRPSVHPSTIHLVHTPDTGLNFMLETQKSRT